MSEIHDGRGPRGPHGGPQDGKDEGHEPEDVGAGGLRCDFCGATVSSVRRIALDHGYDRLQLPHRERYACGPCSERKERERLGLERG
jgi:hypothetical protein